MPNQYTSSTPDEAKLHSITYNIPSGFILGMSFNASGTFLNLSLASTNYLLIISISLCIAEQSLSPFLHSFSTLINISWTASDFAFKNSSTAYNQYISIAPLETIQSTKWSKLHTSSSSKPIWNQMLQIHKCTQFSVRNQNLKCNTRRRRRKTVPEGKDRRGRTRRRDAMAEKWRWLLVDATHWREKLDSWICGFDDALVRCLMAGSRVVKTNLSTNECGWKP